MDQDFDIERPASPTGKRVPRRVPKKKSSSLSSLLQVVGVLVAVGGVVWGAALYYTSVEARLSELNGRIQNVEIVSPDANGTEIHRRLAQAEASVNQLNKEVGKMRSDIGRVDNNASGLGEGLAERVNTLEAQLVSFSPTENGEAGVDPSTLKRLTQLEKKVAQLAQRPPRSTTDPSAPIVIQSDFSDTFPTKAVGSHEIGLMGCKRKSANVICSILVKNLNEQKRLNFYASTRVYVPSGEEKKSSLISYGNRTNTSQLSIDLPKNIPVKVNFTFPNIASETKGFLLLQISIHGGGVDFRNVAITN